MKKLLNKIRINKGSIPLDAALLLPGILLLCFLMVDFIYISNQKADIQRRSDSAALTIANAANVEGEVNIDENGIIVSAGDREGCKLCEITEDDYQLGITQLRKDLKADQYDINYFEDNTARYDKLTDKQLEQLENGVVRLRFKGKVYGILSRFAGFNWGFSIVIDSTAICNGSDVKNGEAYDTQIFNINYELNGGRFLTPPAYSYMTKYGYVLPTPVREGYEFKGWYTNDTFTGDVWTEIPIGSTKDYTFYAKWSKAQLTYTIEYYDEANVSHILDKIVVTANEGTSFVVPTKTFDGFEPSKITYPLNIVNNTIDTNKVSDSVIIRYAYKKITYIVQIAYILGGNQIKTEEVKYQKTMDIVSLKAYEKEFPDYEFDNFYRSKNRIGVITEINKNNCEELNGKTIYAMYDETIYYDCYYKIITEVLSPEEIELGEEPIITLAIYPYEESDTTGFDVSIINCPWENRKNEITNITIFSDILATGTRYVTPKYIDGWFNNMPNLKVANIKNLNTKNVTYFNSCFENDLLLSSLVLGEQTNFTHSTSFKNMFYNCSQFDENTIENYLYRCPEATDFSGMFYGTAIEAIDLSKIDLSGATTVNSMFKNCARLSNVNFTNMTIENIEERANFENIRDFRSMFENCNELGIRISSEESTNEEFTNGESTGQYSNKYIDLVHVLTGNALYMENMFRNCANLKTIYANTGNVSFSTKGLLDDGKNMFEGCMAIVGGCGTTYDPDNVNKKYAIVDTPTEKGYFTEKQSFNIYWELNGGEWIGAKYFIEYYLENLEVGTYTKEMEVLYAPPQTVVEAEIKNFDGYSINYYEDNIFSGIPNYNEIITLKLFYTRNEYTITFDTDGGNNIEPITLRYGEEVTPPEDPAKPGYIFAGWEPGIPLTMPYENTTIKALWNVRGDTPYVIEHYFENLDGSYSKETENKTGQTDTSVTATEIIRSGFHLDTTAPGTLITDNLNGDGSTVLKLYYARNIVTITLNTDGGNELEPIVAKYGMPVPTPPEPDKEMYDFVGWMPEVPTTMPAEDITLVAIWEEAKLPGLYDAYDNMLKQLDLDNVGLDCSKINALLNQYPNTITVVLPSGITSIVDKAFSMVNESENMAINESYGGSASNVTRTTTLKGELDTRSNYTFHIQGKTDEGAVKGKYPSFIFNVYYNGGWHSLNEAINAGYIKDYNAYYINDNNKWASINNLSSSYQTNFLNGRDWFKGSYWDGEWWWYGAQVEITTNPGAPITAVSLNSNYEHSGPYTIIRTYTPPAQIKTVYIPKSVQQIGNNSFKGVQQIYYKGAATGSPWGAIALN